ncbi:MAG: formate dehydrogenase subunit beta [Alcaligenaceae bacterium]
MATQALHVVAQSATTMTPPAAAAKTVHVAKLIDISSCIGCKACQVACMEWNETRPVIGDTDGTYNNPVELGANAWTVMKFNEIENAQGGIDWLIRKDGCMHCEDPGCLKACPSPGAIVKLDNGIVDFNSDKCIGCGYCVAGCPFDVPKISQTTNKATKCTLCSDRVSVGQEPACVKACPTQALTFGPKDDRIKYANERIKDLNGRGYDKASLYNPQGVGGTHVMYVLPHGDKPTAYNGLPADPKISSTVGLWKGIMKPIALLTMAATVFAGVIHYAIKGPDTVDEDHDDSKKS